MTPQPARRQLTVWVRRFGYAVVAAALSAQSPAAALARADNPPVTDDVLDAVDAVIGAANPPAVPMPDEAQPPVPLGDG
jgi:hypothetical protein